MNHPPKPRLVVHVGVTGHRPPKLNESAMPAVQQSVSMVLSHIQSILAKTATPKDKPFSDLPPLVRLISSVAEGADRAAAYAALSCNAQIQCPIPFPQAEYEKDFATDASRQEFQKLLSQASAVLELDGNRTDEGSAYLNAGKIMLEQSDLLIAVWNKKPAAGRGGTAEIIDEARRAGKLVLVIEPEHPTAIQVLGAKGEQLWKQALDKFLHTLLVGDTDDLARLSKYLSEKERRGNYGWLFAFFRNATCYGNFKGGPRVFPAYVAATAAQWDADWQNHSEMPESVEQYINKAFRDHYSWADNLAVLCGGLFRSAYVARYIAGGAAVISTAIGFYHPDFPSGCYAIQIVLLMIAIGLIAWENTRKWHHRFLEHRLLAEYFRVQRFLFPLGHTLTQAAIRRAPNWIMRHFRAVVRDAGMVSAKADVSYLKALRGYLLNAEIAPQIDYQTKTHAWQIKTYRRLNNTAIALFVIGLAAIAVRAGILSVFGAKALSYELSSAVWIKIFSVVFPAMSMMLAGIRTHGEFLRLATRSANMKRFLEQQKSLLESSGNPRWEDSVEITFQIAEEMLAEVSDWRIVVEGRALSLPV